MNHHSYPLPYPDPVKTISRALFSESSLDCGGQELQLLLQMGELARGGIEVKLACSSQSEIYAAANARGLSTEPVPFRASLHAPSLISARRLMANWRPDLVVSHSGHDADICFLVARTLSHRPRLVRARTYQHGVPHAWSYNWLADLTVVPSEEVRRRILVNPRIDAGRIHVLYPGISFETLDAQSKLPLNPDIAAWLSRRSGPVLVHGAMLRPEKGHLQMLEVVAELCARFSGLCYVIAGEGGMRQDIEARINALGLSDRVLLAGFVQPLAPLLKRADLVVMPSTFEPLGMSQSEALALGIPVVASRTGGIPETIADGRTGILVEPNDINQWVTGISNALENIEQARAMATEGRRFVRSRFSIETNVSRLIALAGSSAIS
jgi:glycosyltransferase involved in cell wall biosynthesis